MITYKKRRKYKYTLVEDYVCQVDIEPEEDINLGIIRLDINGMLIIKADYAWDGPSGPTIDTKNFMRGSLVHDVLYQLMREEKLDQSCRLCADEILREMCLEDGMSRVRAWWVFKGVRIGGASSARPDILCAP